MIIEDPQARKNSALEPQERKKTALQTQIDGEHYKEYAIQPIEFSMLNNLDACQHTAIKYILRFRSKNGRKDLEKAIHTIQMLMEIEYGE